MISVHFSQFGKFGFGATVGTLNLEAIFGLEAIVGTVNFPLW
jgi:hypothetical protein